MTRSDRTFILVYLLLVGALLWAGCGGPTPPAPPTSPTPAPAPDPTPAPAPAPPRPCPGPGPCPRPRSDDVHASVGGAQHADGTTLDCELPGDQHLKNCGGSDGSGLCVFTSLSHSARWQNVPVLADFRDWMRNHPGGGYPQKVDAMIQQICKEKATPVPPYVQVEGTDLEVLRAACRSGRMPGVTYSFSPTGRYGGKRISHMVSLVGAGERWFVVLDNNYPGSAGKEDTYEWLSPDEFRRTYAGTGQGWAVILLGPGPPPVPRN